LGFLDQPLPDRGFENVAGNSGNTELLRQRFGAFPIPKIPDDRNRASIDKAFRKRGAKAARAPGKDDGFTLYGLASLPATLTLPSPRGRGW
jgi:hypothetical protein